jgi:ABC-type polysaccharide/polyol phosphate transport system ATPase subunit
MAATVSRMTTTGPMEKTQRRLTLSNVGVRYLLLGEDQRTLKGRALRLFSRSSLSSADFWALQDINAEIRQGEVVGIIGRNGSGKSTLLRVMSGTIAPTRGKVAVEGRVTPLLELGGAFNMELTGRENAYLYGSIFRISRAAMTEMIPKILAFSELGIFFDTAVKTYSAGMVSRLAFSISTQLNPDILLVDEVLAVGDEAFQKKCLLRIRKLIETGSIVVLVSHASTLIEQLCTRAIYLSGGKLVADGPARQVVAQYQRDSSLRV